MRFKKEAVDKFFNRLEKQEVNGEVQYFRRVRVFNGMNEDGTPNWKNLWSGGYWNAFGIKIWKVWAVVLFVVIVLGFIFEYHSSLQACTKVMSEFNTMKNLTGNFTSSLINLTLK